MPNEISNNRAITDVANAAVNTRPEQTTQSQTAPSQTAPSQAAQSPGVNRQNASQEAGNTQPLNEAQTEVNSQELQEAVTQLNEQLQNVERDLFFSVDDSSGRTIVQVVNTQTEEVVRQIPSEEVLRISRNIQDVQGDVPSLFFETSA